MWVIWRPISSMCPASMSRGDPFAFTTATELPCTSALTASANLPTSSRQTRAGAASKPDGPGVSSSRFKNSTLLLVMVSGMVSVALAVKQPGEMLGGIHEARPGTRSVRVPVDEFLPLAQHGAGIGIGDAR